MVTYICDRFVESVCYEVLLLMFQKKLNRDNNLIFIVSLLVSSMADQVHRLCFSDGPYALLYHIHSWYELDYESLVNLLHLSPASPTYIYASDKHIKADCWLSALESRAGLRFQVLETIVISLVQ